MKKWKQERAITLIALVITIIVLLILAGISIAILTGENGILNKATEAGEETKKAEYKEILEIIGNELQIEKVVEQLTDKEYMDRYEEKIKEDSIFKEAKVIRKDDETILVTTKEGYVYKVTIGKVEYIGKQGASLPPDLQEGDVTFKMVPSEWTKDEVSVEITTPIEGYILQYSTDGITWTNYTTVVTMVENGVIYARLINKLGGEGSYVTENVTNIDKIEPTVSVSSGEITSNSAKLTVTASDEESGLATSETYQYYLGTTLKATTNTNNYIFTGLESGTDYTLKVIVSDKAGNTTEKSTIITTIKPKTMVTELTEGEYVNYVDKNGTTRKCVVLYNNSDYGLQIIVDNIVESVTLGSSDFSTAGGSYNSAISTLNTRANAYLNTAYASSARSVGSVPNNPNSAGEYYTSSYSYMSSYNRTLRNTDTNYTTDWNQMGSLGIRKILQTYWLASCLAEEFSFGSYFYVRYVSDTGGIGEGALLNISSGGTTKANGTRTNGLRPIFTLKSEIKITGGIGTNESPYTLGT